MFCYSWDLFGETAAAWVQAIGTLAALVLAMWMPIWHAKKAEQEATLEQLMLFLALATEVTERCDRIFQKLAHNPLTGRMDIESFNPTHMQKLADRCHDVSFTTLRDYRMLEFIDRFPDRVSSVITQLKYVQTSATGENNETLKSRVGVAKHEYEHVTRTVNGLKILLDAYRQPWWRFGSKRKSHPVLTEKAV